MKTSMTIAAATIALLIPNAAYANETTIELGQVGLSFYAVKGGVVQELLERDGYNVEVTEGSHAEIFPMLGEGKVDILAATWLPNGHSALYEPVKDVTFQVATLYEDARFFWVVPSYVPESTVSSIADLTDPDVRGMFPDQIISLPEATGLTAGGRRIVDAYGLDDAGYELIAAPPAEWLGTFEKAIADETWVVFPLWQPQWINAEYDVRLLEEPLNAYGEADTAYLLGHQELKNKLSPESLERLSNVRLSIEDVTEMDRMVNVDGITPREAARTWIESNRETIEEWGYYSRSN